MNDVLPVATYCIYEATFSSINAIETVNRSKLKYSEDDKRVCLSTTARPLRKLIVKANQTQNSH